MPYESLIMLADHYRVSIDYLLNRTDTPFMAERYTDEELEVMQEFLNLYKFIKNRY
ncbi:hypothetical protein JCM19037_4164 [Geomicrobium sp. JCM 19037]|uniref:hypothetical protein n=1 Tax=Geomicrobium sp. JCM 19037 TaxID=1460634 RepID=UPI00045F1411|nr:hypothetical protein [Geomicrobium sp. JCM 19037]GAK05647.1 hypothetical protein JCM19037_4164 [Geomicrobium sp. JCM 19037]